MTKPANTLKSGKRGGKTRTSWKPGQSGNPAGAPKRGESWAEIIKLYADMTPEEIADKAKDVAGQLRKIGGGISMKEAVVIRIYAALMFEPTSGLWKELMERAEGKVTDKLDVSGDTVQRVIIEYAGDSDENQVTETPPRTVSDQAEPQEV